MKVKLATVADEEAFKAITGLSNPRSTVALIGAMAAKTDPFEDFECIVKSSLLKDSYRSNPSLLAIKIREKTTFVDCAGYQTPHSDGYITIILFREKKNSSRYNPSPGCAQQIKAWLDQAPDPKDLLKVPTSEVPGFYLTHPEQLAYKIHRETGTRIKITRFVRHWNIQLK